MKNANNTPLNARTHIVCVAPRQQACPTGGKASHRGQLLGPGNEFGGCTRLRHRRRQGLRIWQEAMQTGCSVCRMERYVDCVQRLDSVRGSCCRCCSSAWAHPYSNLHARQGPIDIYFFPSSASFCRSTVHVWLHNCTPVRLHPQCKHTCRRNACCALLDVPPSPPLPHARRPDPWLQSLR